LGQAKVDGKGKKQTQKTYQNQNLRTNKLTTSHKAATIEKGGTSAKVTPLAPWPVWVKKKEEGGEVISLGLEF